MGIINYFDNTGVADMKKKSTIKKGQLIDLLSGKKCGVDGSVSLHRSFQRLTLSSAIDTAYRLHATDNFVLTDGLKACIKKEISTLVGLVKTTCRGRLVVVFDPDHTFPGKQAEHNIRRQKCMDQFDAACKLQEKCLELEQTLAACQLAMDQTSQVQAAELKAQISAAKANIAKAFKVSLFRHPAMIKFAMDVFYRDYNVPEVYLALYEADSELAHLAITKQIDIWLTDDSDSLVYGAPAVLVGGATFKYVKATQTYEVALVEFASHWKFVHVNSKTNQAYDYSAWENEPVYFQAHACLMGCDYTNKQAAGNSCLRGIGPVLAYDIVHKCVQLRMKDSQLSIAQGLQQALDWVASEEYINEHKRTPVTADSVEAVLKSVLRGIACFNCQYVYDISTFDVKRYNVNWPLQPEFEAILGTPKDQVGLSVCLFRAIETCKDRHRVPSCLYVVSVHMYIRVYHMDVCIHYLMRTVLFLIFCFVFHHISLAICHRSLSMLRDNSWQIH